MTDNQKIDVITAHQNKIPVEFRYREDNSNSATNAKWSEWSKFSNIGYFIFDNRHEYRISPEYMPLSPRVALSDHLFSEIKRLENRINSKEELSWTHCIDQMPPMYKIDVPYLFKVSDKYSFHYELARADDEDFFNKYGVKNLQWKPIEYSQVPNEEN
jgi:hypothetical protein